MSSASKYSASHRFFILKRHLEEVTFYLFRRKTYRAHKKSAVDHCKTFFESYEEFKVRVMKLYPTLGPEEYEWKRTIGFLPLKRVISNTRMQMSACFPGVAGTSRLKHSAMRWYSLF